MGLGEWFAAFCTGLTVKRVDTISSRYRALTKRLNGDFWETDSETAHSLYVGSYGRNTAIEGFSDLDVLFQLPYSMYERYNGYTGNGQSALLQAVKTSIERTYATTSIRGDGQVIQVPFTDGLTFEVVPAFTNRDGSYTFPDANGGGTWRTTDPRPEIAAMRARNLEVNANLVPLCRMMRAWKRTWDVPMGGLLVDTLAYQFIEKWPQQQKSYLYYDWMSRDFFRYLADQDDDQEYWRAPGSGQSVYKTGSFQWKATRAYNLSQEAIEHECASPKREWSARQTWRKIFGIAFPD